MFETCRCSLTSICLLRDNNIFKPRCVCKLGLGPSCPAGFAAGSGGDWDIHPFLVLQPDDGACCMAGTQQGHVGQDLKLSLWRWCGGPILGHHAPLLHVHSHAAGGTGGKEGTSHGHRVFSLPHGYAVTARVAASSAQAPVTHEKLFPSSLKTVEAIPVFLSVLLFSVNGFCAGL